MSILIRGMEMPQSCFECPFMLHRCFCLVNPKIEFTDEEYSELKGRYSGCPLAEVPTPHGRLIDMDVILAQLREMSLDDCSLAEDLIEHGIDDVLDDAPTIIERED